MQRVRKEEFGALSNGSKVELITLTNDKGDSLSLTAYGARIVSLIYQDGDRANNVVLGFDQVQEYEQSSDYLGATVGPVANRISHAEFRVDNKLYNLPKNEGDNINHTGELGLDSKVWKVKELNDSEVVFTYNLDEEKYPGKIDFQVKYSFNDSRQVEIDYKYSSDADTYVNLTNHSYFNLNSEGSALNHCLEVNADFYTPCDAELLPTGEILKVDNSEFDYRSLKSLEDLLNQDSPTIAQNSGLDNNFVLNKEELNELSYAARIVNKDLKKQLVCFTTAPGIQIYTANGLSPYKSKTGREFGAHSGICMETQFFPDSMNITHFPSPLVHKDKEYSSTTVFSYVDWDSTML